MAWQPCAAVPGVSDYGTFVSDGSHLFSMGGYSPSNANIANVNAYDRATDTWTARTPLPFALRAGAAAYAAGRIYYVGGVSAKGSWIGTVYAYDPANDAAGWMTVHALPSGVFPNSVAVFNGKIYGTPGTATDSVDIYVYDPGNDAAGWMVTAPLPVASHSSALGGTADKLYHAGGVTAGATTAAVYSYDTIAGWQSISALPFGEANLALVQGADGRLWCAFPSGGVYSHDLVIDGAGWRAESSLPVTDHKLALVPLADYLFFAELSSLYKTLTPRSQLPAPVVGSTVLRMSIGYVCSSLDPVVGSTSVTATVDRVAVNIFPVSVIGVTAVTVNAVAIVRAFYSDVIAGSTTVAVVPVINIDLAPETVYSQGDVDVSMALGGVFDLDVVAGSTDVWIAYGDLDLALDAVRGSTGVEIGLRSQGVVWLYPDRTSGATAVQILYFPDADPGVIAGLTGNARILGNTPILLAFTASAQLESIELLVSI